MISVKGNERVLVCPLGWGLGHATRVIPIISSLLSKGCTVIIAGDKTIVALLRSHFPSLEYIHFPSFNVKFSRGKLSLLSLIRIANRIVLASIKEHSQIQVLVNKHKINFILSDNRYGLWLKGTRSALITHQLNILFPYPLKWLQPLGQRYITKHAERFTECLVPDLPEGKRLTGNLTKPKKLPSNVRFIGILSRFSSFEIEKQKTRWDMLGIVSGPEPQRQIFEDLLVELANKLGIKTLILQGLPRGHHPARVIGKATLAPHLPDVEIANAICSAKNIVCRSGYSTIMDLIALNRKAILVPTPGQTEQEYLGYYLSQHFGFKCVKQCKVKDINIV